MAGPSGNQKNGGPGSSAAAAAAAAAAAGATAPSGSPSASKKGTAQQPRQGTAAPAPPTHPTDASDTSTTSSSKPPINRPANIACQRCRQKRTKCVVHEDQARCVSCEAGDRECVFAEVDRRKESVRAQRARLAHLEKLFDRVKTSSGRDLEEALEELKRDGGGSSIVGGGGTGTAAAAATSQQQDDQQQQASPTASSDSNARTGTSTSTTNANGRGLQQVTPTTARRQSMDASSSTAAVLLEDSAAGLSSGGEPFYSFDLASGMRMAVSPTNHGVSSGLASTAPVSVQPPFVQPQQLQHMADSQQNHPFLHNNNTHHPAPPNKRRRTDPSSSSKTSSSSSATTHNVTFALSPPERIQRLRTSASPSSTSGPNGATQHGLSASTSVSAVRGAPYTPLDDLVRATRGEHEHAGSHGRGVNLDEGEEGEGGEEMGLSMTCVSDTLTVDDSGRISAHGATSNRGLASGRLVTEDSEAGSRVGPSESVVTPPTSLLSSSNIPSAADISLVEAAARNINAIPLGTDIRTVEHLLYLFFMFHHSLFPVLSRKVFVEHFYSGGQYFSPLLLNAILSVASHMSDWRIVRSDPNDPHTAGDSFFETAKTYLEEELERPSITTVQALALIAEREAFRGRTVRAGLYHVMFGRLVLDLGLHLDATPLVAKGIISHQDAYVRSQTYFGLWSMDQLLSAILGRPSILRNVISTCPRPGFWEEEDFDWWASMRAGKIVPLQPGDRASGVWPLQEGTLAIAALHLHISRQVYWTDSRVLTKQKQETLEENMMMTRKLLSTFPPTVSIDGRPVQPGALTLAMCSACHIIIVNRPFLSITPQRLSAGADNADTPRNRCYHAALDIIRLVGMIRDSTPYRLRTALNTHQHNLVIASVVLLFEAMPARSRRLQQENAPTTERSRIAAEKLEEGLRMLEELAQNKPAAHEALLNLRDMVNTRKREEHQWIVTNSRRGSPTENQGQENGRDGQSQDSTTQRNSQESESQHQQQHKSVDTAGGATEGGRLPQHSNASLSELDDSSMDDYFSDYTLLLTDLCSDRGPATLPALPTGFDLNAPIASFNFTGELAPWQPTFPVMGMQHANSNGHVNEADPSISSYQNQGGPVAAPSASASASNDLSMSFFEEMMMMQQQQLQHQ